MLNSNDGQAKLDEAVKTGKFPDVFYDAPGRIIVFANNGLLLPVDDILATEKPYITIGLLAVSQGKDRRTYMYPMHEGAFSMAFNKEMLEDLGLLHLLPYNRKDRQWTCDEYETLLRELKEKLPKGKTP
ncbi:MAG: extracellular solute-binding protein [Treponema sp.]